jgi:hypothetical protein
MTRDQVRLRPAEGGRTSGARKAQARVIHISRNHSESMAAMMRLAIWS